MISGNDKKDKHCLYLKEKVFIKDSHLFENCD